MSEASSKSRLKTCGDIASATSSPASAAGRKPCGLPGQMTLFAGRGVAHVNPFRAQASGGDTGTNGTSGPNSTVSSASAALSASLENRLRANLDVNGSMEYRLTWKHWDMQSGRRICALRASARRDTRSSRKSKNGFDGLLVALPMLSSPNGCAFLPITLMDLLSLPRKSGRGFGGWPTARAEDSEFTGAHRGKADTLTSAARLAGWQTPKCPSGGGQAERQTAGGGLRKLEDQAQLAGWPTPRAEERNQHNSRDAGVALSNMAGWASPSGHGSAGEISQDLIRKGGKWVNKKTGRVLQTNLATDAKMLVGGWATPSGRDWKDTPGMAQEAFDTSGKFRDRIDQLARQAMHLPISGQPTTSSPAGTGNRGALNPEHSRWLMGFPAAWGCSGATAMRSCRRSRRRSSRHTSGKTDV